MSLRLDNNIINQKATPAFYSDIIANRPAAGFAGRIFISTDSGQIFEDTGTTWSLIADAGVGGGTLSSVCLNGNTTATGIVITAGGLSTNSLTDTTLTSGSVIFADGGGLITQSNASFFWDNTNKRLGLGTNSPGATLDIHSTGVNAHFNGTGTNNAYLQFQNAGTNKWRIGNTYNAGANTLDFINNSLASTALSFSITTNAATFNNSITATSFIKTGGTSSQFLKADGSVDSNSYITLGSLSATSPVQYNNTTGVISILQAGASQSGYLSSTDWNTFNNKASLGSLSASSPLLYNSGTGAFSIQMANSGQSGYLSNTDWNTFNNKQNTITTGNLTETSSSILTISGGTGAVIGSGTTIAVQKSSATTNGYLSSTDWNTFNNKATPLNGVGFVKVSGTTISYDNSTYYLASNPSNFITLSNLAASSPLVYNNTSGGFSIQVATTSQNGYLSSTDWNTFNNKQDALTLTTTGTSGAATLIGNTLNIPQYSGGGGTPGGSNTQVQFNNSGAFGGSANFVWNNTNNKLTVGGSQTAAAGVAQSTIINPTLIAAANSDKLIALDVTPTFTLGSFTGLSALAARFSGNVIVGAIPSNISAYTYVPLTLANNANATIKTQLALINGGGGSGAGSAIDFFTYVDAGNGLPGIRIITVDDGAYSGNFQIQTKASGGTGTGALSTKFTITGSTGAATFSNTLSLGNSSGGTMLQIGTTSTGTPLTIPTAIQMDNTYKSGIPAFNNLKFYLFKSSTETYGFNVADISDLQYWAGTSSSGIHRFFTSQTERMRLDASGNLGLNTITIGSTLQVNGNAAIGYSVSTSAPTNGLAVSGKVLVGTTTDNGQGSLQNPAQSFTGGLGIGGLTFSTNTTATVNTSFYFFNGGAGVTLTLPDTNGQSMVYTIKNYSTSPLTIGRTGSNTFIAAGATSTVTSLTLTGGASTKIIGNATTSYIQLEYNNSGTYTPTLTNNANITSSTAYQCQYMRVGNVVTVSGQVDITATSALTLTQLIMTLPISSSFPVSGFNYCGGTAYFQNGSAFATGFFRANQSATTVSLVYYTGATTPTSQFFFSFTYQIV